jgi:Helix-turn-helix domain (DUF4817)
MPRGRPRVQREFSLPERAKFVLLYERCQRSYEEFRLAARRNWDLRDPDLPPRQTLDCWIHKFEETGHLERVPYHREK